MKNHEIKLHTAYWDDVVIDFNKTAEYRWNDRNYQKGDTVSFEEVDERGVRTLRKSDRFLITHVLHSLPTIKEGYCMLSIKKQA